MNSAFPSAVSAALAEVLSITVAPALIAIGLALLVIEVVHYFFKHENFNWPQAWAAAGCLMMGSVLIVLPVLLD